MSESEPAASVTVLAQFDRADRERLLAMLEPQVADELRGMLEYPEDSAGRLMDPSVTSIRSDLSIVEALGRLRAVKIRAEELLVVDEECVDRKSRTFRSRMAEPQGCARSPAR